MQLQASARKHILTHSHVAGTNASCLRTASKLQLRLPPPRRHSGGPSQLKAAAAESARAKPTHGPFNSSFKYWAER